MQTEILKRDSPYSLNTKNKVDGLKLLSDINDGVVSTSFFDPQYRGVLDKLKYGNEGKQRGQARCELPQMDEDTIKKFIFGLNRVLKPSGHLFLWVDKFHLCTGISDWYADTDLNIVDMIVWDKARIGMGYRSRRKSEYLIAFQKSPVRAKDCWTIHTIPDVWTEKVAKTHPHSKPVELQKQLILATAKEGEVVCDPASGGYSVLEAVNSLGDRMFIGGDIEFGED